jgi:hypothetical protein
VRVFLFAVLLPLSVGYGQQRRDRTPITSTRLQLFAEVKPAGVKPGGPVTIEVKLKNVSSKNVHLGYSEPIFNYGITVVDMFGKEPPRTEWGDKLLRGEVWSISQQDFDLEPGKEEQAVLDITKIFQLTQPGTYFVRINRFGIWTEKDGDNDKFIETCYSPTVQFTISP